MPSDSFRSIIHQVVFYISSIVFLYQLFVSPLETLSVMAYAWIIGTTIVSAYYHRCLSHRSWQCPMWLQSILLFLGAGHAYMPAVSWVNVHLRHHRYSDTDRDPHGPHKSLLGNLNLAMHQFDRRFASRMLLNDTLVMLQLKHYWAIMAIYFVVWSFVFSPTSWFIITGSTFLALVVVNLIGHWRSTPVNIPVIGLFFAGETYHKNHHEYPNNPKFGRLDPAWWFIKLARRT